MKSLDTYLHVHAYNWAYLIDTVKSSEILTGFNLVRFRSNIAIKPWFYCSLFPLIKLNQLSNITNIYLFLFVLPLCYCLSSGRHPPKTPTFYLGFLSVEVSSHSQANCRFFMSHVWMFCTHGSRRQRRRRRFPAHGSFLQQQTWYLFFWYGSINHPLKSHSDESWLLPPLGLCSSRFMHCIR